MMNNMKPNDKNKLQTVTLTIQEIWAASRQTVSKNKKKYNRKSKINK